jgi:arylsulfatase A-like enzyme
VADNGFQFGEHRINLLKHQRYDGSVHIPMRAFVPGMRAQQIMEPVSNVDLAPTILHLARIPPKPQFDGRSLFSGLPPRVGVIIESPYFGWVGIRTPSYKLIREPGGFVELYHIGSSPDGCRDPDPFELENSANLRCYEALKQALLAEL